MKKLFFLLLFWNLLNAQDYRDQFAGGYYIFNVTFNDSIFLWIWPDSNFNKIKIYQENSGFQCFLDTTTATKENCSNWSINHTYCFYTNCGFEGSMFFVVPEDSLAHYYFRSSPYQGFFTTPKWYRFYKPVHNDPAATFPLTIYPNPVKDIMSISIPPVKVKVYVSDVLGKRYDFPDLLGPKAELDVSNLPPGLYWLRLKSELGSVSKSFVKQ